MAENQQFVYKIGTVFPHLKAADILPISDLDKNDGFIHLSTREQVPGTVGRFFKQDTQITLLKIRTSDIAAKTRWEESKSHGVFPHIYGDLLGSDILESKTYRIEDPGNWEALLSADTTFLE
ncbi:protein of unknown function [Taphrina deformans PYCC 5710]|uniref:DUF952 domain protein n=1 Tax=Taphrina deformans (strain PYCC 5710 / ATCC 11124 / CBS 356.35 / IMI 108563 / JCM 9778 / NBRC 8474) TaxID=1097556 RepID=R4XGB6_TAPDE|nr:protein of unknown function [Taphrina deformans PYCC 5710]|eukprot:CCG84800.1 protein of unknown function [Taphrina deformans PYCC 5710]